jgi:hypothetical protein
MVADKFTDLQKAVGPEITKTDLVPAFQVKEKSNQQQKLNVEIKFFSIIMNTKIFKKELFFFRVY